MAKIDVQWRGWYKGLPPRPIKLQIPGWAGQDHNHDDGATPQPWHCPPFVEGSTYGLELLYPFDSDCYVCLRNGKLHFDGDFSEETHAFLGGPPFKEFAPGHYGFTSSLDLLVPDDMVVRVEPHPRFFTDVSGTVPCAVPGHIHTAFWPKIFFVVFKAPWPGQTTVFRKGEPYAQVLVLPKKVGYDIRPMPEDTAKARQKLDDKLTRHAGLIAKHKWRDVKGQPFDDKYKVLHSAFAKGGLDAVTQVVDEAEAKQKAKDEIAQAKKKRFKRRLVATREETLTQGPTVQPTLDLHFGDAGDAPEAQAAPEAPQGATGCPFSQAARSATGVEPPAAGADRGLDAHGLSAEDHHRLSQGLPRV